jgi:hypothetical protein
MAMAALAKLEAPTAAQVDTLALEYTTLKDALLQATLARVAAQEKLEPVEAKLVDLVSQCGSAHAQKSKILHGLRWEIMGTFGKSTSIDAAAVERLRLHLLNTGKTRLLKRLFESTVRWDLKSTARAEILKPDITDDVRANFVACEVTKDRSPSLTVREK